MRVGKEQQGFNAREPTVHLGLLALVLEILDRPHTANDDVGLLATRKFDGEVAVGYDTDRRRVGVDFPDGCHPLVGGLAALLALIHAYADDEAVE